jgi:hypothetical protein
MIASPSGGRGPRLAPFGAGSGEAGRRARARAGTATRAQRPRSGRLPAPPFQPAARVGEPVPAPFRSLSMLRLLALPTLYIFPLSPVLLALWTLLV